MASRSSATRRSGPGGDASERRSVGQFVVDRDIGKGSFAQVYSGKHKDTGAIVAIKTVELAKLNKKLKENLYSEIKILKTLRHPHIVALHDCVESSTHINILMEYCELGDLSLFIKKREKLITNPATHEVARKYPSPPNSGLHEVVIRHFLKQLVSALKFLREGNFVHRDVKPQNLLLLPSPAFRANNKASQLILSGSHDSLIPVAGLASLPMLKLADFGFARVLPSTSLAETLCGSPLYMAPEILRYERYDAKADLWSVGAVLHEMVTGRPPFKASNHVELLRKIEAAEDQIRYPRDCTVSSEMKSLIRALLKRNPVERLSFDNFFSHPVVTGPIPAVVEDDLPPEERPAPKEKDNRPSSTAADDAAAVQLRHKSSFRRYPPEPEAGRESLPPSPRPRRSSPLATPISTDTSPLLDQGGGGGGSGGGGPSGMGYSPGREGLGIRPRPRPLPSATPSRPTSAVERKHRTSNASLRQPAREGGSSSPSSDFTEIGTTMRPRDGRMVPATTARSQAEQEVAFERDYVVVEKRHVEVNAFADEMAANRQLVERQPPRSSRQMVRRTAQQGSPVSSSAPANAVPIPPSGHAQAAAQGKIEHYRHPSYDKGSVGAGSSPGSATSYISKAIQDASLRLFGFRYAPPTAGKGPSPPQLHSPFPAYPTPTAPAGLIGDGRQSAPVDEDSRVAQCIEDYATRSDVVYGFAEVKYKQLVPVTPSADHTLGGVPLEPTTGMAGGGGSCGGSGHGGSGDDNDANTNSTGNNSVDDGLTMEAVASLSEEALVLYVKALSLLAKSMDIANLWWTRKSRAELGGGGGGGGSSLPVSARESSHGQMQTLRINAAVQWIRSRFNEVLEKADIVRLKLVDAQRHLPPDHPSHPSNHPTEVSGVNSSGAEGVFLTAGISAEKLMYDRALEMSRAAAINEIANEDLTGCEISYITAIRMLEAVLDNDDGLAKRRPSNPARDDKGQPPKDALGEMNSDDQQAVQKVIHMVTGRLGTVRKKLHLIKTASMAQQQQQTQYLTQRRSGDLTPRSVPNQ